MRDPTALDGSQQACLLGICSPAQQHSTTPPCTPRRAPPPPGEAEEDGYEDEYVLEDLEVGLGPGGEGGQG